MKKLQACIYIFIFGSLLFVFGTVIYFSTVTSKNYSVVTLESDGGKLDKNSIKLVIGEKYGDLPVPEREGYTFDGWFTGKKTGDKITKDMVVSSKVKQTLYARWTYDIYNLSPIVSVNNTSVENGDYYGSLYSSKKYINKINYSSFMNAEVYNDNSGLLQYDDDGALLLDEDNSVAVLDIDSKYKIGDNYSLSTTFYWDKSKVSNNEEFSSTLLAISANVGEYLSWIGIDQGFLFIYTYYILPPGYDNYLGQEMRGYQYIDLNSYDKSVVNLQVVSVRDKKTNVYINGELVNEFSSGSDKLSYNHLTLGDLRIGRNLKFVGKIYDFAIFDKALSDEQIKNNYKTSYAYKSKKTS